MGDGVKKKVVIIGAGRVGCTAAAILAGSGRYEPLLADIRREALDGAPYGVPTAEIGYSMGDFLHRALPGADAVLCAIPGGTIQVAEAARVAGCHYVDLADDTSQSHAVGEVASDAASCFATSCGFAPGYATALLRRVLSQATPQSRITLHAGILPAEPAGRLGYANLWGIDGLLAEYTKPCLAIRNGSASTIAPLGEHETLSLGGDTFEAFTTSGTLDGLVADAEGQVAELTFKTLRYPGHLDYMLFLLDDMGLRSRLYQLKSLLMNSLPYAGRDRAIIHISHQTGENAEPVCLFREFAAMPDGRGGWVGGASRVSAIHACAVIDVICSGKGPGHGHHSGDRIALETLESSPLFTL